MKKTTVAVASLLACASVMLSVIFSGIALAHHRDGHTKGGSGGGGDTRESFNAGVRSGTMYLFPAFADISLSSKSKPAIPDAQLIVKKSRNAETQTFLKFKVTGLVGDVTSAKVLLRSIANSGFGGGLWEVGDWSEEGITWETRPAIDPQQVVPEVGGVVTNTYYEWDVSEIVTGDGDYSFALTCASCQSKYQSLETSMTPYLAVVAGNGPSVDPEDPIELVFAGAGDIANCGTSGSQQTAQLLAGILADHPITGSVDVSFFTAGDNAYPDGTLAQFNDCYHPSWGEYRGFTNPSPGNHDYITEGAAGYFGYFSERAGTDTTGYYSYTIGSWLFLALNSNCAQIGGCGAGSPQELWLRDELAAHPTYCTVAYLHHPPHSSGEHGGDAGIRPLMQALYDFGAEILIAGHDHNYERFTPQNADGVPDLANGVRLFVVGSGGASLRAFRTPIANSAARFNSLNGVLKLTLHAASYDWEFMPVAVSNPEPVEMFEDNGSALCHY